MISTEFFEPEAKLLLDEKVERLASDAARRTFVPELMNGIDKTVVFRPLREQLERILDIELAMVQQRLLTTPKGRFVF